MRAAAAPADRLAGAVHGVKHGGRERRTLRLRMA
jgi:hypothetical protein